MSRAPRFVLTFILWAVSRSRFRETVGNSSQECQGLIDLLIAEGKQKPVPQKHIDAVLALRPDSATHTSALRAAQGRASGAH
jgi:2-dehydropantoate 2-reductase